jgi:hypothetical protein
VKKDLLEKAAQTEETFKAEEAARLGCKHPHIHFQNSGRRLRCIDCKRFWLAGWVGTNGMETDVADYAYQNPAIMDYEFRHSPDEAPRRTKLAK